VLREPGFGQAHERGELLRRARPLGDEAKRGEARAVGQCAQEQAQLVGWQAPPRLPANGGRPVGEQVGKKNFTVTLKPGTYSFLCDPHTLTMFATFTVPATVLPIAARVTAAGKVTLTSSGRAVRTLTAGQYAVRVRDESRALGFRLQGPGVHRATGARFRGSVTWRVRLRKGTYRYGSGGRLRTLTVR
jgi:hypothetical protein